MPEPHSSYGFFTTSEAEFLSEKCPLKHKKEIKKIKSRASARKRAHTLKLKEEAKNA